MFGPEGEVAVRAEVQAVKVKEFASVWFLDLLASSFVRSPDWISRLAGAFGAVLIFSPVR